MTFNEKKNKQTKVNLLIIILICLFEFSSITKYKLCATPLDMYFLSFVSLRTVVLVLNRVEKITYFSVK